MDASRVLGVVAFLCGVVSLSAQPVLPATFYAELDVTWGGSNYKAGIYINNENTKAPILNVWSLAAVTQKTKDGKDQPVDVRTVYKSDIPDGQYNYIIGQLSGAGPTRSLDLNTADCNKIPLGSFVDLEVHDFLPIPVEGTGTMLNKACPGCKVYNFVVAKKTFNLLVDGDAPKIIFGPDEFLAKVTSFTPGPSKVFAAEDIATPCAKLDAAVKSDAKLLSAILPTEDEQKHTKKVAPKTITYDKAFNEKLAKYIKGKLDGKYLKTPSGPPTTPAPPPKTVDAAATKGILGPQPAIRPGPLSSPISVRVGFLEMESLATAEAGTCGENDLGNGRCDADCNTEEYEWDLGDCCQGTCKLFDYYTKLLWWWEPVRWNRRFSCGSNGYTCRKPVKDKCAFYHGFMVLGNNPATMPVAPNTFSTTVPGNIDIPVPYPTSATTWGWTTWSVPKYWADMNRELEGLCTAEYNFHNTIANGWNITALQTAYHGHAAATKLAATRDGGQAYIFGHSMANMILGGACYDQGLCDIQWIDLGGPVRGSKVAAMWISSGLAVAGMQAIATLRPDFRGLANDAAHRDELSQVLAGLRGATSPRLLGAACGTSAVGSWMSPHHYLALGVTKVWNYGVFASSDGVVGLEECSLYGQTVTGAQVLTPYGAFGNDPLSPFYTFPGNHLTATGSEGDAAYMLTYIRARVDKFVSSLGIF